MKGASSFKEPPAGLNEACNVLLVFLDMIFVLTFSFFLSCEHFLALEICFISKGYGEHGVDKNTSTVRGSNGMLGMARELRHSGTLFPKKRNFRGLRATPSPQ